MEISGNILDTDREGFRRWLEENSARETSCWVVCSRGAPREGMFCYIDAVEEALCFGWIDSTSKKDGGKAYRRFSSRRPGSHWTEMNKARVRRLERLGLMTDAGRAVLPDMDSAPRTDPNIRRWFREHPDMEERFLSFPRLYRDIQMSNLEFYREFLPGEYRKKLKSFRHRIETGSMVAGWDDYGRLTDADCAPGGRRAVTGKQ